MGWLIQCPEKAALAPVWASNIVDLVEQHLDACGWLICGCEAAHGYIEKHFELQEGGDETWEPFIRGVIRLGEQGSSYQPVVFLVSYEPTGPITDLWFCYYKDTRLLPGGRLKMGHGPGGPPVLGVGQLLDLLQRLIWLKCLSPGVWPLSLEEERREQPVGA
ncbi:MAG: hypothetical protein U0587_15555 [Candidatus Binatia bacterium]